VFNELFGSSGPAQSATEAAEPTNLEKP
jgi:hypothetical protein